MAVEVTSLVWQLVEAYKICHLVGLKKKEKKTTCPWLSITKIFIYIPFPLCVRCVRSVIFIIMSLPNQYRA